MKFLVACDSFKGCMSSSEANQAIEKGLKKAGEASGFDIDVITCPIADGGEGLTDAFAFYTGSEMFTAQVPDLYGNPVMAPYAYDHENKVACFEVASVVGLPLYPKEERKPLKASSYGLGILMQWIMARHPVKEMIIGLGGTGTNDGGAGLLEAYGAVYYNDARKPIAGNARNLGRIAFIDKRQVQLPDVKIRLACDVKNLLLGENGATWIYGRQKGLSRQDQIRVEEGMRHFANKIRQTFHVSMDTCTGGGAAGGLGAMFASVFHAEFEPGIELICDLGHLKEKMAESDFVISGEGQSDAQSLEGKAVFGIARLAAQAGIPMVCLSGALGLGYEGLYEHGVSSCFSSADRAMSFPTAIARGPETLEQTANNLGRLIAALKGGNL